ncbi:MAG: branched-chain amino acid ABC transporter permease [Euryarchaeota archaeon]|nr:branched-chain amino acid ABC transporter permease [Euryarchaeota archaeon]
MSVIDLPQLLVNILITGSLYALLAAGLTMVYRILRFPNFAHAELITTGAYTALFFTGRGLGFLPSAALAFLVAGLAGVLMDVGVFRPLRRKGAAVISMMVASIGVGFVLRHIIQEAFGATISNYDIPVRGYDVLGARITSIQVAIVVGAVVFIVILHLTLTRTRLGKAMRATSDNPSLAMASGIPIDRVILGVWFFGGGVAGVAGVLRGADTRLVPTLGWEVLLFIFAVVLLGGIGSIYGTIIAAYVISLVENVGVVFLIQLGLSASYRPAIAFFVLILVLLFKPQGIMGIRLGGERE